MTTAVLSPRTKAQALNALEGMAEIVRKERLVRGDYVSQDVDPEHSTAICHGHRYCAIGSLWAGAGVHPEKVRGEWVLPGVDHDVRAAFLRRRHGLRVAYEALNTEAAAYIKERKLHSGALAVEFAAEVEQLFESPELTIRRSTLIKLIDRAKERLA